MEDLLYPSKININEGNEPHTATLVVEPLFHGYGTTLGNALRRVLLSSLTGAAATAVKIKGVQHEFSTIPHVKEDVLEIILNLKGLRLSCHSDAPVKLTLSAAGEKKVTAKDIVPSADVEIVNPKMLIATLTDPKAELEMEITVERGRGYVPTEERSKEKFELGTIAVDALFSPVRSVGFRVEAVRVGEITNFDRLLLDVETDGTISPEDAIRSATEILIKHFNLVLGMGAEIREETPRQDGVSEETSEEEEAPKKKRATKKKS